jgi:hypothetical protein
MDREVVHRHGGVAELHPVQTAIEAGVEADGTMKSAWDSPDPAPPDPA